MRRPMSRHSRMENRAKSNGIEKGKKKKKNQRFRSLAAPAAPANCCSCFVSRNLVGPFLDFAFRGNQHWRIHFIFVSHFFFLISVRMKILREWKLIPTNGDPNSANGDDDVSLVAHWLPTRITSDRF